MKEKKKHPPGETAFGQYYATLFGDRWEELRESLGGEKHSILLPSTLEGGRGYALDRASYAVARLLPLGDDMADLCAAPGGKTLVLAHRLVESGRSGFTLAVNELSRERRRRLENVLGEYLPPGVADAVTVSGYDARRWGLYNPRRHHAILLDVPCSSERHVLASPVELGKWTPARIRQLTTRQYALLAAAVDSLAEGGYLLYSTCALSPDENENILRRILTRKATLGTLETVRITPEMVALQGVEGAEERETGIQIMPDRCNGAGPMYCALLRRR